jgi:hypothetical protein
MNFTLASIGFAVVGSTCTVDVPVGLVPHTVPATAVTFSERCFSPVLPQPRVSVGVAMPYALFSCLVLHLFPAPLGTASGAFRGKPWL